MSHPNAAFWAAIAAYNQQRTGTSPRGAPAHITPNHPNAEFWAAMHAANQRRASPPRVNAKKAKAVTVIQRHARGIMVRMKPHTTAVFVNPNNTGFLARGFPAILLRLRKAKVNRNRRAKAATVIQRRVRGMKNRKKG